MIHSESETFKCIFAAMFLLTSLLGMQLGSADVSSASHTAGCSMEEPHQNNNNNFILCKSEMRV